MSIDMKKELLRIRVSDLKAKFSSSKDGLANEVLSEALAFAESNRSWKFWVCCRCNEKFVDSESHMHHVVQEHMGNLMPKMQSVLPQNVDNEWIEMLLNCSWKPLDVSAAVGMLRDQRNARTLRLLRISTRGFIPRTAMSASKMRGILHLRRKFWGTVLVTVLLRAITKRKLPMLSLENVRTMG
ncbi:uncharacterized protein Pyn_19298 [Prunus yedoensis var. nudiflora]|uniref:C2H2-type domain-containing protein n=1 Tax=Prunus yedoensis var. nudiflora TaxID=2094558 RepID=A0A314YIS8_PRUYE|nr:uncharacterized protein Pyn_19298 [Prunus yedoensis var. nudiflora]